MTKRLLVLVCLLAAAGRAEAQTTAPTPWYQRIQLSGDFRTRYEGFYQDTRPTRNRARMRARLTLDTKVNEDTRFTLRVASGDTGTPVSTNQTFSNYFLPKPISLDRAYLTYAPVAASWLTLGAGKFPAPQAATQLVFDEDLNFEGGWEQVSWKAGERVDVTLGSLQTVVNEISGAADSYMLAGYGEVEVSFGRHSLKLSAADYGWAHANAMAVASSGGPLESILTNAVVRAPGGNVTGFASRFNVVDAIAEATFATGRADYPLRVLADFAHNTRAASARDSGLWIEAEYGRARRSRSWSTGYTYGSIEQDATPSAYVFSDMPGTNIRLHMLELSYVPKAGLSIDTTLHLTKRLVPTSAADAFWLSRLHVGAVVRF